MQYQGQRQDINAYNTQSQGYYKNQNQRGSSPAPPPQAVDNYQNWSSKNYQNTENFQNNQEPRNADPNFQNQNYNKNNRNENIGLPPNMQYNNMNPNPDTSNITHPDMRYSHGMNYDQQNYINKPMNQNDMNMSNPQDRNYITAVSL